METDDKELRGMIIVKKAMDLCTFSWEVRLRIMIWAVQRFVGNTYIIVKKD